LFVFQLDQKALNLKEELNMIIPFLEEMRKRKNERRKQFVEVFDQICQISNEIHISPSDCAHNWSINEKDLSLKRLEDLHSQLHALQKEKVLPPLLLLPFLDRLSKKKKAKILDSGISSCFQILVPRFKSEHQHPILRKYWATNGLAQFLRI